MLTPEEQRVKELAGKATSGPWRWRDPRPVNEWGHQGPDLITVAGHTVSCTMYCRWKDENGVVHKAGPQNPHEHFYPDEEILESWGYDADGLDVYEYDAEFIAATDPQFILSALDRLEAALTENERLRGERDANS